MACWEWQKWKGWNKIKSLFSCFFMWKDFNTDCFQVWRAAEYSVGGTQQKDLRRRVHQIWFQVPTMHCCVGFQEAEKLYAHDLHRQCWWSESYGTVPVPIVTYPEAMHFVKKTMDSKRSLNSTQMFALFLILFLRFHQSEGTSPDLESRKSCSIIPTDLNLECLLFSPFT